MKTIVSASRRTDIPAFYLDWFIEKINQGYVKVRNPLYRENTYTVSLKKDDVHSIALWSKDFGEFLKKSSEFKDYNLYFIFTINNCKRLEPNVISLDKRINQLEQLVEIFGSQYIQFRFDPIVFWRERGDLLDNMGGFEEIVQKVSGLGIDNCMFSFANWYQKSINRFNKHGLQYFDPPLKEKIKILTPMAKYCKNHGVKMYSCCNSKLAVVENVYLAHCIDGNLLSKLFNEKCSIAKAPTREGCGCTKSKDIGNYNDQICNHACLYCYAHPYI